MAPIGSSLLLGQAGRDFHPESPSKVPFGSVGCLCTPFRLDTPFRLGTAGVKASQANYNLKKRPMKKKPPVVQFPGQKPVVQSSELTWHNGADVEINRYARSLHKAAKDLIATLDPEPNPKTAWDACPVILLYRESVELHLKALIGEGCKFLPSPTDPLSLAKTHSLRWLAQIVCQIIKTLQWESEFKCDSVTSLADFSALVNELEALDPVSWAVHSSSRSRDGSAPPQLQPPNVVRFARKLDGLLDLLDAVADGLAAAWDLQQAGISSESDLDDGGDFKPTIQ